MNRQPINIAIETSGRRGSVAVGRGDALLENVDLPEQRRHAVALLPVLDALAERHGFTPAEIGECHVSIGPGSFTGLRVAVTAAKMLARVHGTKLVAVPTLDVVVRNTRATCNRDTPSPNPSRREGRQTPPPPGEDGRGCAADGATVAVLLNAKGGRWFTGIYDRRDDAWIARDAPALLTPDEAIDRAGTPLSIIADRLPDDDLPGGVTLLDGEAAVAKAEHVRHIGRAMAERREFADPYQLAPLYVRLPDAEEKWRQRREVEART